MGTRKSILWTVWVGISLAIAVALGITLFKGEDKSVFLPGQTTAGHYQIELQCHACHGEPFSSEADFQNACMDCHGDELERAQDSHPRSKFTDPRNADRLEQVDARQCISCHTEHHPDLADNMGLTLPGDYCAWCHQDIAEDRPSHQGMAFNTCADAGCHNYHDNRALYEDFLLSHAGTSAPHTRTSTVAMRNLADYLEWENRADMAPQRAAPMDNPYHDTVHQQAGVTCAPCHGSESQWQDSPAMAQCASCHQENVDGFLAGRHGMRLAQDLPAMHPQQARLPMQADATTPLTCNSCHKGHQDDVVFAATEACLGCHADDHSQAFPDSPHGDTWAAFKAGEAPATEAVSCATCHMPRINEGPEKHPRIHVQHNQNDTLRPNEKMIRPVCLSCHSLQFSLNALADHDLVERNFGAPPGVHVPSIDMAVEREEAREKQPSIY